MDQEKGVNKHPTLCPLYGEQQPWDYRHARDHPGVDCFPVLLVPKARRKQGAVPQAWLPEHLFISLFMLVMDRPPLVPFGHVGGVRG